MRTELVQQIARLAMSRPLHENTSVVIYGLCWDLKGDIVTDAACNVIRAFVNDCTLYDESGMDIDELTKKELNLLNDLLNEDPISDIR